MRVYVAGHSGLVGSAVSRALEHRDGYTWLGKPRADLDLCNREAVFKFFEKENFDVLIMCAAKVGGIKANNESPVEFLSENLQIQTNLLDAAHHANIDRVVFLASSCVYPKTAQQPLKEEYLFGGPLEDTNDAYAIAKLAGIKMVQSYRKEYERSWISLTPTNIYGPYDNFTNDSSHVVPALIRKIHRAKLDGSDSITLWGSGLQRREFLHSDDLADAVIYLLENFDDNFAINVGYGEDIELNELAHLIAEIIKFKGKIYWDSRQPDGMPRKLLDLTKINQLGWQPKIPLVDGIVETYNWYIQEHKI